MRADARANRAAIIDAARRLYTTRGPDAPLSAIAEEAGVGAGTLYRHFPTQQDLVLGVVEWLSATIHEVCERWLRPMQTDPHQAWPGFVADIVELRVAALMPRVIEGVDIETVIPQISRRRDSALAAVGQVVELAKGAGLVREDVTAVQFQMGLAVATRPLPSAASALVPDVSSWLVEVYLRGLRPD